ncbi:macro domain-containing protein [Clostridium sp. YIM B02506]|uniref:macro domain-containing protein n=1 Tax=Clostridium sp. YIM B02506 TaxID=2910680 RepID=UPI001EEEB34C|nr:macro domain-containing protein [Clostridium sp. YIM B02506]
MGKLKLILGDITKENYTAIINNANSSLLGGGGIDGVIHRTCGDSLLKECKSLEGCKFGYAKITKSYNLADNGIYWIIHMVNPIWQGGTHNEHTILRNAYKNALGLCIDYKDIYLKQTLEAIERQQRRLHENRFSHLVKDLTLSTQDYIDKHPIKNIAIPFMNSGVYCFPVEEMAFIALEEVKIFLDSHIGIEEIAIVCPDQKNFSILQDISKEIFQSVKI